MMVADNRQQDIAKEPIRDKLYCTDKSAIRKYQDFFVGRRGFFNLVHYEFHAMLLSPLPGAAGLFLRKLLVPRLLRACGGQSLFGRDIQLRCPGNIIVGERVAIDDHCLFDAKARGGIHIGDDAIIARDCIFHAKAGNIILGDRCVVGNQTQISSTSGIRIGNDVGIGGQCYIGGGLYHTERRDIPIMQQGLYSRGPVVIGDDVWIGAGVRILDGVTIGRGTFIGAGAVISRNVPEFSMIVPYQKIIELSRGVNTEEVPVPLRQKSEPLNTNLRRKVLGCIAAAIHEVNLQLPPSRRLSSDETSVLFNRASGEGFDSLGLVNFIVICEQKLEEELGRIMDLAVGTGGSDGVMPFANIAKLADYITAKLQQGS